MLGVTRNWGKTVVNWNLALDPTGGPHNGGCDTCTGVRHRRARADRHPRTPSTTRSATSPASCSPARCGSPAPRSARPAGTGRSWTSRSATRDGSTALVVHNENDDPRTFAVAQGGHSFDYTLPGGALATFTWPSSRALDDGLPAARRGPTAPRPRPSADPATRSTTTPPRAGRAARPSSPASRSRSTSAASQRVRRVVLDTGADVGDFPRGYALYTSTDGSHWTSRLPPAPARASSPPSTFRRRGARYLRVVQTATAPQWWSSPTCGSTAEEESMSSRISTVLAIVLAALVAVPAGAAAAAAPGTRTRTCRCESASPTCSRA